MTITNMDSIVSCLSNNNNLRVDWSNKCNSTITIGTNFSVGLDMGSYPSAYGTPNAWSGTSLAWTPCNESTGNGTQVFGIPHGGNTSPDTKHILNASTTVSVSSQLPASGSPGGTLVLVDLQGYWANINLNTTSVQNLTGTPGSNLRYANGAGCRLYMVATNSPVGTTDSLFTITYADTAGNSFTRNNLRKTGTSNTGSIISYITTTGANAYGRFLPLANGDIGVSNCTSIQFNTAAGGSATGALCLAKPLLYLPILDSAGSYIERQFLTQVPSLPRVMDGACLTWLYYTSQAEGATLWLPGIQGHLEFIWG